MSVLRKNTTKIMAVIFSLILLITLCAMMTFQLKPKAKNNSDFDFATMSKAATTYLNWASDKGGAYVGSGLQPGIAAGLVGFQSKSDDAVTSFVYGTQNAANSVVYSYEGLNNVKVTDNAKASKSYVDYVRAIESGKAPTSTPSSSASPTDAFYNYACYGYLLSELGFDQVGTPGGSMRMIVGVIMLAVYLLAQALTSFMDAVIDILQMLNPFLLLSDTAITNTDTTTVGGSVGKGLELIRGLISGYYNLLRGIGIWVIVPITLAFLVTKYFASQGRDGTVKTGFKKWFIRLVFIFAGVPMMLSLYSELLSTMHSGGNDYNRQTKVIASTFLDFQDWVYARDLDADRLSGFNLILEGSGSDLGLKSTAVVNERSACFNVNTGSGAASVGATSQTFVDNELALAENTASPGWTAAHTVNVLTRYTRGEVISSADYASQKTSGKTNETIMETSRVYQCFDPYQIADSLRINGNSSGLSRTTAENIATNRYTSAPAAWGGINPWLINGTTSGGALQGSPTAGYSSGKLSWMGMYNYLNSEFTTNGVVVYAPDTTSDQNIKYSHYSVNVVGTGIMRILYIADAIVLLGCITVLGYIYGITLLVGAFKAMFQAIGHVFGAMLGSMKSIGSCIALLFATIVNIVLTFLMLEIAAKAYDIVHYIILQPIAIMIDNSIGGSLAPTALYILSMLITMFILTWMTKQFIIYRSAICSTAIDGMVNLVNKLVGENVSKPDLSYNGNLLQGAAALAGATAVAAANGAFDDVDSEKLGMGKDGILAGENGVSDTMGDDESSNAFGVVGGSSESKLNGEENTHIGDEDSGLGVDKSGNLVDEDGNELTDSDGNTLGVDENGNLTDSEGNPLTDENGDPISADNAHLDENGNLVDENGNPIKDASGGEINSNDVMGTNEDGEVVDQNGDAITDAQGNALGVDENVNVVDQNGNPVKDSHGGNLKKDPKTGKIVDSQGHAVKADANGNFKDGSKGDVKTADGKSVSGNPTAQAHANGNLTDSEGNVLTDENGEPLKIDDDPSSENYGKVVDADGNVVTDSKGNELSVGSGGVVRDGDGNAIRANADGTMVDGSGEPIKTGNGESVTNTGNYDGPNTALENTERGVNPDKQAADYIASTAAAAGVAGVTGAAQFNNASVNGKTANGKNAITGGGKKTTGSTGGGSKSGSITGGGSAQTAHTDAGLMLSNGNQINDVAMPEGSTAGVVTEKGFMSQAEADSRGLSGVSAIQTEDGNIIYGMPTDGGDFVPGIQTENGFVPGVTSNGKFVPGGFDTNGNFHAGVYTDAGFTEGAFKNGTFVEGRTMPDGTIEAGQYTSNGFQRANGTVDTSAVIPDMGNSAVGSSVISNSHGAAIIDSSGKQSMIYSNSNGDLAVNTVNGGKVAVQQNGSNGNMSYVTADGKQLDIKSGSFDQMQVGSVDASVVNGGIALSDGTGGVIPITDNGRGSAAIGSGQNRVSLTTTSGGMTALATGDGNSVGMYTAQDGSLRLQTKNGEGLAVTALDNGGMGIVDSSGNTMPIVTSPNGHLAIQNGNDFIPVTADGKGNVMMGNNKPHGGGTGSSSTYFIPISGGGVGISNANMHCQTSSGRFEALAPNDSDGVVELVSSGNGGRVQLVSDGGQRIDVKSQGAGSVRIAGGGSRTSTITGVDESLVVDGGASGATGKPNVTGTYRKATSDNVTTHAVSSNSVNGQSYGAYEEGTFDRGSYGGGYSGGNGGGGYSGGMTYNATYASGSNIARSNDLGGFTVETFNGGQSGPKGMNSRTVKISGNAATNSDYNIVKMMKDNPMATAMIISGIANKNVGTVAMGAAMGYSNMSAASSPNGGGSNNYGGNRGNGGNNNYGGNRSNGGNSQNTYYDEAAYTTYYGGGSSNGKAPNEGSKGGNRFGVNRKRNNTFNTSAPNTSASAFRYGNSRSASGDARVNTNDGFTDDGSGQ